MMNKRMENMKMKKTKDIIIDFTSLLDVTMIILFFFILFSFKETEQVKSQSNEAVERAETMMQEAEKQQKEALKKTGRIERIRFERCRKYTSNYGL